MVHGTAKHKGPLLYTAQDFETLYSTVFMSMYHRYINHQHHQRNHYNKSNNNNSIPKFKRLPTSDV